MAFSLSPYVTGRGPGEGRPQREFGALWLPLTLTLSPLKSGEREHRLTTARGHTGAIGAIPT